MVERMIIEDLRMLGIGRQYLGHNMIVKAVMIVIADSNALLCVKRKIFQPIAGIEHCDWRTIERDIRTAIGRAWKINRTYLIELAHYPLHQEPTVTEFLEIISAHAMRR